MSAGSTRAPVNVFVTGATGVVGIGVVPRLIESGHQVTAVGRTPEKRSQLDRLGARAVELDLFDAGAVRRALAGHDVVINLATHMPSSSFRMLLPWSWKENDRVRREGSAILAHAAVAAGVSRLIQESFAPVYEGRGTDWIDESCPVRPAPYNRTVLDAERSAEGFTASGGVGIVLRFAGFYGPDPFLRDMVKLVRRGWSPLPGPPGAYWSSVSHEDAATAVIASLVVPAGIYNVCDDDPLTRREFADALARAAQSTKAPRLMPAWMTALGGRTMELLSRSERLSNRRLKQASGWRPTWPSVREGLPVAVHALR